MATLLWFMTSTFSVYLARPPYCGTPAEWCFLLSVIFQDLAQDLIPALWIQAAVGSSKISTSGSMAMTPATRRFWPPESRGTLFHMMRLKPYKKRASFDPPINLLLKGPYSFGAKGDILVNRIFKQLIFRVLEHQPYLKPDTADFFWVFPDIFTVY